MRHGWLREAQGVPTLDEQRATLVASGVDPERISMEVRRRGRRKLDPSEPTDFDHLLVAMRPDDQIAVATAACLGASRAEITTRILAICTRRGQLFDCEKAKVVEGEAGVQQFTDRAERALAYSRTYKARKKLEDIGRVTVSGARRKAMIKDWLDPGMTAAQVAAKHGLKRRQMFNVFKGVPKA